MPAINWKIAHPKIIALLKEWISGHVREDAYDISDPSNPLDNDEYYLHFLSVVVGDHDFMILWKSVSSSAAVLHAIHFLKSNKENKIPIVAVPFMGPTGKKLCEEQGVNWMDLLGNAFIQAPGLLINSYGKISPFKSPLKRPKSSVFSPKASRVIRWMLLNPNQSFTNNKLVHETGADAGHISRILYQLKKSGYISEINSREYRLQNSSLLLQDWRDSYDFFKHNEVIRGHIPARNSEDLVDLIGVNQILLSSRFAFTGLTAAWRYTKWVSYRLVTVYCESPPNKEFLQSLQFKEEPRGANVWFAIPKDNGVFTGGEDIQGIPCVSRIQTYLDLKDQPERSKEAAEELLRTIDIGEHNG